MAIFPDESLATSSQQFDKDDPNLRNGRLYNPWEFWCPDSIKDPSYLELILAQKYYIFAVSIQGQFGIQGFTDEVRIIYADDYENWKEYNTTFKVGWQISVIFFCCPRLVHKQTSYFHLYLISVCKLLGKPLITAITV